MNALTQIENASNGNRFDWFHIADRMTECSSSLKRDRRHFFFSSLQLNIEPLIGMKGGIEKSKETWTTKKKRRETEQIAGLLLCNCQIGSKCPYEVSKNTHRFSRFIIDLTMVNLKFWLFPLLLPLSIWNSAVLQNDTNQTLLTWWYVWVHCTYKIQKFLGIGSFAISISPSRARWKRLPVRCCCRRICL